MTKFDKDLPLASLWNPSTLEHITFCPVCMSSSRAKLYTGIFDRINKVPGLWSLYRCLSCKAGYIDPRPNRENIHLAYESYYTHNQTLTAPSPSSHTGLARRMRNGYLNKKFQTRLYPESKIGGKLVSIIPFLRDRAEYQLRHLNPPIGNRIPKLLEIGCGDGRFLAEMRELGWEVLGLEPDLKALTNAQRLGVPVIHGAVHDMNQIKEQFDAIVMYHVIEHLHDPIADLIQCRSLLKRGGTLSIVTPNLNSFASKVYREDWHHLHVPNHLILFTHGALCLSLKEAGFHHSKIHASSFAFGSTAKASASLSPRLRSPRFYEELFHPYLVELMASIWPSLKEEIVVTAFKD